MDYKLLLDTAVLAGALLLENGAETYRVEDTMQRILSLSGLKTSEAFVTMTGFSATLDDPSVDSMTVVRRVKNRGINLTIIDEVNRVSRDFCSGNIDLETAFREITEIEKRPQPFRLLPFMAAYTCIAAGFTMVSSTSPAEIYLSGLAGCLTAVCQYICRKRHVRSFLGTLLSAAVISVTAGLGVRLLCIPESLDNVVIGAIMPLVPGVAITNATFDTLNGDYLSGAARVLEAFVTAAAIAIGISLGLRL